MRSPSRDRRSLGDAGAVTAEFAAALPAVVLVLAFALGAIELGGQQLRLQEAAFVAARLLGRGDPSALARIQAVEPTATLSTHRSGVTICADVNSMVSLGVLSGIDLHASACVLDDAQS